MSFILTKAITAFVGVLGAQDPATLGNDPRPTSDAVINQIAEQKCAGIEGSQQIAHRSGDDIVRWLARDMPVKRDEYDTEQGFQTRFANGINSVIASEPVFIFSIELAVQRYNSEYDARLEILNFRSNEQIPCIRGDTSFCLRPGYFDSSQKTIFSVYAAENSLQQSFSMPPETARHLRDGGRDITMLMVASLRRPYRTFVRQGSDAMTVYHLHAHCISYYWPDPV